MAFKDLSQAKPFHDSMIKSQSVSWNHLSEERCHSTSLSICFFRPELVSAIDPKQIMHCKEEY